MWGGRTEKSEKSEEKRIIKRNGKEKRTKEIVDGHGAVDNVNFI